MQNWQDGYANTNGIRLHYCRAGGDKPQLLFAHSITDSGLCWGRLARALEADYDSVEVDARGHGFSDKPATGYTADDHAKDLVGLMDALALDRPVLIGHSTGDNTATALAARYLHATRGAVWEDPGWWAPMGTPEERAERTAQWRHNSAASTLWLFHL